MRKGLACVLFAGTLMASAGAADAAIYGAIATTSTYPVVSYGYGLNARTRGGAETLALANCRAHTRFACIVRIWFAGPGVCGAIARRGTYQSWAFARGIAGARTLALRGAGGGVIVVTACNGV